MKAVNLKNRLLQNPPKNGKFYIVGIDGRGGAGKTTLTKYIEKLLPDFTIVLGDDYFEPDYTTIAFGSFNDERFFEDVIKPLQQVKKSLIYKPYDWHSEPYIKTKKLRITKGIIIERSFSFAFALDFDLKIWVETPAELALERGLERDQMLQEEAVKSWIEVWQPQESAHIQTIKPLETADIVIDGTQAFDLQLN